jgi:hypothetical protein
MPSRKERLQKLTNEFHRSRYGDYDTTFVEFAATYGLKWDDDPDYEPEEKPQRVPRWATVVHDETYALVEVFNTKREALDNLADCVHNDSLNSPEFLIDLDRGEAVGFNIAANITSERRKMYLFKKEEL